MSLGEYKELKLEKNVTRSFFFLFAIYSQQIITTTFFQLLFFDNILSGTMYNYYYKLMELHLKRKEAYF